MLEPPSRAPLVAMQHLGVRFLDVPCPRHAHFPEHPKMVNKPKMLVDSV